MLCAAVTEIDSPRIKLTGDWAPNQRCIEPLPWGDLMLVNLEGPVLDSLDIHERAPKAGPHLAHQSLPMCPGTCVLTLANNHLMDYGQTGLEETICALAKLNFRAVGAGKNAAAAASPLIFDWGGARIAILSRCEVQFGIATDRKAGVAAYDETTYQTIRKLKSEADIVIASIHAAAEMCPWPSPKRQNAWRALIEAGADVVHGHHAHVPQGWETHEGGMIFYGLGNLCVDPVTWLKHPNALWSLTPEVSWASGKVQTHIATAIIEDLGETVSVRDANDEEARNHQIYLDACNRPLADHALLEGLWQEVSLRLYQFPYAGWLRFDNSPTQSASLQQLARPILRRMRSFWSRSLSHSHSVQISQDQYLLWYHLFACESHSDAIATALGVLGGALEDRRDSETARLVDSLMPIP
jgi:hypothetical protein